MMTWIRKDEPERHDSNEGMSCHLALTASGLICGDPGHDTSRVIVETACSRISGGQAHVTVAVVSFRVACIGGTRRRSETKDSSIFPSFP